MLNRDEEPLTRPCQILFVGGRVIDPETGLDAVRNVGVLGGSIAYIGQGFPHSNSIVDVTGLVIAPGFIDMHSHAQSPTGLLLQALDGVTTALDLEAGALPISVVYERAEAEGRPINFGFSSSWALARMQVLDAVPLPDARTADPLPEPIHVFEENQTRARWNTPASEWEVSAILDRVEQGVHEGGIGIGVLLGYSPESGREEFFRTAQLAERLGVPAFTHSRQMSNIEPGSSLDGALEIIGAAAGTGAALHICHINSTSLQRIDDVGLAVENAQARGNRVTTEAYPYAAGSTGVGAAFFEPDKLDRLGITTRSIQYLPTGERIASVDRLVELRQTDPGGMCIIDFLDTDDPTQLAMLIRGLTMPGGVIASDSMPLTHGPHRVYNEWPPPEGALTHPRSAGCFARTLGWLVRELGVLTLMDALARVTSVPASILEDSVPAMRKKGRVQVGADADLAIFDPETISDRATFETLRASTGFRHVVVGGTFVVRDGAAIATSRPGRAIRSERR
ncbi:amidohydrolase family protein [Plantibacter elymi (nom. nud.)]|uniref:amidohydrolase family protein n=1 Tax=Plantibacter elymi (nom. nud.) TaxID=199708 RepID=UPI001A99953A|nr:amidohydrolase family protein [Plantibacter sp. VKM Ac-1784]